MRQINNGKIELKIDAEKGIVNSLKFNNEKINWLISEETLKRYNYTDALGCLLGKSMICYDSKTWDTSQETPGKVVQYEDGVDFIYKHMDLELVHGFRLQENTFVWSLSLTNLSNKRIEIDKMYHWMPMAYIMHQEINENLEESCAFVPSLGGSKPYVICKKRNGIGNNLIIINQTNHMKSTGSWCKYENLFFEKSAPSLSGLILHNTVNCYSQEEIEGNPAVDWPYRDMYKSIVIESREVFNDEYHLLPCTNGNEIETLVEHGINYVEYPSVVKKNQPFVIRTLGKSPMVGYQLYAGDKTGRKLKEKKDFSKKEFAYAIEISGISRVGEHQLTLDFEDGSQYSVIFAVYDSFKSLVNAFCEGIYKERFIGDTNSENYAAYQSVSRQGETCAKGSLLLYKNLISGFDKDEIQQVEKNAVYYLRKRWLDDDFKAIRQYPGGFARILDMDYLILEFYLLSLVSDDVLQINDNETYLLWAYKTAAYRYNLEDDKLPRETEEVKLASMISWIQIQMPNKLRLGGYHKEAQHLDELWRDHIQIQLKKIEDHTFVETEHYFDNAGISMIAETLLNAGEIEGGIKAAELLLHNVANSNDYRSFAPDRWWEALAIMYHNLWAVFSAKAMLTAYEKSLDNRFLFSAYKAMVPMFYNYDWNAVSALNKIAKGQGVSAYCITSPNLNLEYASRNRFGQSVFKDDFFAEMDLVGDDWDMGADMLVYLTTFGQKCYVTTHDNELTCVNGELTGDQDEMEVTSHAAYPSTYYIEPFNFSIVKDSKDFMIHSITIKDGQCTKVTIKDGGPADEIHIYKLKNDIKTEIFPSIIRK